MNKSNKFSPEVRERAVRMVHEQRREYPSLWAAVESIAPKIGCVPQTLLEWVKRQEVDAGVRAGVTTNEAQRVKDLEREVKELRRANEILKLARAGSTIQRNTFVLMLQFREGGMYGSNGTPRSFRFPEVGTLATLEGWRIA